MRRAGTADLPLHHGRVPQWLASRMTALGRGIVEAIVMEYGPREVLTRLGDPFWFQALGCVMGMDWHSSGITTSVMGALKRAINPIAGDLGLHICGGRGKHSLNTPRELDTLSSRLGLDGDALVRSSRLSAKVDNTCIQDGFSLYLHTFVVSVTGEWTVVQQGMNDGTGMARRYHWHSPSVRSFVDDPRSGIVGVNQGAIINLSDSRAADARSGIVAFLREHPDRQVRELRRLVMARSHEVGPSHVDEKRLGAVLALAYERQHTDFTDALLLRGVGPRTLQSLALVSEVIYGAPSRFDDPARFSFAHGGKDGSPFPVPLKVYDQSIGVLKRAVERAKIDHTVRVRGLRKLSDMSYALETSGAPPADVTRVKHRERRLAPLYGGRTVFDEKKRSGSGSRPTRARGVEGEQLSLF